MRGAAQPSKLSHLPNAPQPSFGAVFSHSITETVIDPEDPHKLTFETWNGGKTKTSNFVRHGDREFDLAALRSLPEGLDATLVINQRDLRKSVRKFLLASGDRHFHIARGNNTSRLPTTLPKPYACRDEMAHRRTFHAQVSSGKSRSRNQIATFAFVDFSDRSLCRDSSLLWTERDCRDGEDSFAAPPTAS